jgi:sugar phosphate permease
MDFKLPGPNHLERLKAYQKWAYLVTFGAYFMAHFSRKCYSTVKPQLKLEAGLTQDVLSEMDSVFMATYALGSFISGRLGDIYRPTTIISIGLLGSGLCLFFMLVGIWFDFEGLNGTFGNLFFLTTYFIFGFFQSTGGPVGTAIMGSWFCDTESVKARGMIFGTWTCHQYLGDIFAAVCTAIILKLGVTYWWALVIPALANVGWGFLCMYGLTPEPEEIGIDTTDLKPPKKAGEEKKKLVPVADASGTTESKPIGFIEAFMIPNVAGYAFAFGFFKLTNYVLFFWLPYFLGLHFDPTTANLVSTLYSFGMMPGGIIVGKVSDLFGGKRATVICLFQMCLIPLLWVFAVTSETLPIWAMMVMLCMMGILIGGPNNILTSAVAADLSEHPMIGGNSKSLGTITGIINGSGSITAAIGLLVVGPMTKVYGWSSVWYFMMLLTFTGTMLLMPNVKKEMGYGEAKVRTDETSPLLKKAVVYGENEKEMKV